MNLIQKTFQYAKFKRKGIRKAFSLAYEGKLSSSDYFLFISAILIVCIMIVLRYADYIDGVERHAENMRQAAEFNKQMAEKHEATIVSMLNGEFVMNGQKKSVCIFNAAGDCK